MYKTPQGQLECSEEGSKWNQKTPVSAWLENRKTIGQNMKGSVMASAETEQRHSQGGKYFFNLKFNGPTTGEEIGSSPLTNTIARVNSEELTYDQAKSAKI